MSLLKTTALSLLTGLLAGTAAAVFLILLNAATEFRNVYPQIIWFLPVAGFLIGWVYYRYGTEAEKGNNLILDEIHDPKRTLPLRMAPFVLFGTVITHLFGGSAGREGTAVQMGASLSDQLAKFFRTDPEQRKILLVAGAGAGFGAAIGAPLAGVIFGMEVISIRRLKIFAPLECLLASYVAFYTSILLRAPHSHYPAIEVPAYRPEILGWVAVAGICFGLAALVFVKTAHAIEFLQKKFVDYPPLRPFLAGILLCALYWIEGSYQYVGLGIPVIQGAILEPSFFHVPALKIIFTALTVGSGFKGGEFIPLVFIGSTLGSALSQWIPVSTGLLGALGFAAVFGAGANTPVACTIMAMEIFGPHIALYAFVACFFAYYSSGHHGIYKAQRIERIKLPLRVLRGVGYTRHTQPPYTLQPKSDS